MQSSFKTTLRKPLLPLARWLAAGGVHPDHVTVAGLVASLLSGLSIALGRLPVGLIWFVIALLCDVIDGDIARLRPGRTTRFGAFLDSSADRASEAFVFGGLLIGKAYSRGTLGLRGFDAGWVDWVWLLIWVLAFTGSFLVSYTRARAEGLGLDCTVGFAERPERMVVFLLLLICGFGASLWFLMLLTLMTWWTVYQRVAHVATQLKRTESGDS
ncbi:CDP-alcohol phosphatidyltransferase family protein [Candidatus Eisenbacteria bacterium]|uniref:CDP-alcohol phosphatidyltransferase family protein n=1 Tax=Eiseniibacteriota bacterium TaxID=2212470 RepID=A0ABV6YKP7_UNCEI